MKYNIIYFNKIKINNMYAYKFLPFLSLFFMMFLVNANAYNLLYNFTGSTPITLRTDASNYIDKVKAQYFIENQSWFVTALNYGINKNFISRWQYDFTFLADQWTYQWHTCNANGDAKVIDWFLNTNSSLIGNPYQKILYVCSNGQYMNTGNTSLTNNGIGGQWQDYSGTVNVLSYAVNGISIDDTNYEFAYHSSSNVYYANIQYWFDSVDGNHVGYYNGTLIMPTIYTISNYDTIRYLYIPTTDEYWLFFVDQYYNLRLNRYDNTHSYINTQLVISNNTIPNVSTSVVNIYPDYSVYKKLIGNVWYVYMGIHTYFNNTLQFYQFDTVATKQTTYLTQIDNQVLNMTTIDSGLIGNKIISGFYIASDGQYNYLFYAYNTSGSESVLKVVKEIQSCSCSDWINTGNCVNNQRQQIRSCNPSYCDITSRYVNDDTCQVSPNGTQPSYKRYENSSACIVQQNYLGREQTESSCSWSLSVPSQCQPNTVNVTITGLIDVQGKHCDQGYYNITLCNPSIDCKGYGARCDAFNQSFSYTKYNYYQPNSAGLLQVLAHVDKSCSNCWFTGIDTWLLYANYYITCNINCYEHWYCPYNNYEAYETVDCLQNNLTYCPYGCNKGVGRCYSQSGQVQEVDFSTGNPFDIIKNGAKAIFPSYVLLILSVGVAGSGMIIGSYQTKSWQIGLAMGLIICCVFWALGWLDAWILYLWGLTVVLLISKTIYQGVKGGQN